MMVSYAQNFEDVMLFRAFKAVENGFYVDLGASHPVRYSVTKAFYDRGWAGINVEPGSVFEKLARARPRDVNLQLAVGRSVGWVEFWEFLNYPEVSTTVPSTIVKEWDCTRYRVPQRSLSSILGSYAGGREIHFLKVDVEGAEEETIRSCDWNLYRPLILVIEATAPVTEIPTHKGWEPFLLDAGYLPVWFDGINRWYVREESKHLATKFQKPISAFDLFIPHSSYELQAPEVYKALRDEVIHLRTICRIQEKRVLDQELMINNLSSELEERDKGILSALRRRARNGNTRLSRLIQRLMGQDGAGSSKSNNFTGTLDAELNKLPEILRQRRCDKKELASVVTRLRGLVRYARAQELTSAYPYGRELEELAEGLSRLRM